MRATAAVLYEVKKPLVIEEVELLDPGPHEVQVRWVANGVCHSDYHLMSGDVPHPLPWCWATRPPAWSSALAPASRAWRSETTCVPPTSRRAASAATASAASRRCARCATSHAGSCWTAPRGSARTARA